MSKKKRPDPVSYLDDTPVPMLDFWERAVDFLEAYKNLRQQRLFDWARYSLIGHAVEVGLKSYLMARGFKRKKLQKKFGHDLGSLLAEAKSNGLPVSAKVERDIGYLNHVHDNYLARYPEYEGLTTNNGKGIIAVEELAPSVETLLQAIGQALAPKTSRRRLRQLCILCQARWRSSRTEWPRTERKRRRYPRDDVCSICRLADI